MTCSAGSSPHLRSASTVPRFDQSNADVVHLIAGWAEHLGFEVNVRPLDVDPNKFNLVAKLGQGPGGLVLSGHTDTVPYDESRWQSDPFDLRDDDGRLHGLGAADMKAFFPSALFAASEFAQRELRAPIYLVATADEESTMAGARALCDKDQISGQVAVIGEPTGMKPVHTHKGVAMQRINVIGRSGHSSDPGLGVNAIEGLQRVVHALEVWRKDLGVRYVDPAFSIPFPTLNFGRISGGDSPNRICGHCTLDVDLRLLPTMDLSSVIGEMKEVVASAVVDGGWSAEVATLSEGVDGYALDLHNPFCQTVEKLSGERATAALFGTEAPFFTKLGMDTIVLGAGDIEVAHQPNEFVEEAAIERATQLYAKLVHKFCVEGR